MNRSVPPHLATGGDLIFMGGTNDRYFRAFDARTGDKLWEYRTNSGITAVPVAYDVPQGGVVWSFAIK